MSKKFDIGMKIRIGADIVHNHIDTILEESANFDEVFGGIDELVYYVNDIGISDIDGEKNFTLTVFVDLDYEDKSQAISMFRVLENHAVFYNAKNYNINLIENRL